MTGVAAGAAFAVFVAAVVAETAHSTEAVLSVVGECLSDG